MLSLSATFSFSQANVNDNTGATGKTGTGSFGATILTPLTIEDAGTVILGEFVKSTTPYTPDDALFEGTTLDFYITGEPNHEFFYQIVPDFDGTTGGIATIELSTLNPSTGGMGGGFSSGSDPLTATTDFTDYLDESGSYLITLEVSSLTAIESGTDDFVQTVYVSYTSF